MGRSGVTRFRLKYCHEFIDRTGKPRRYRQIAGLQRIHIVHLLGSKKPFAARNWLKALRGLMQFLVATEQRIDDPTAGIRLPKTQGGEIHSWTEAEIKQYEA